MDEQNTLCKTLPADVCVFGRFERLSLAAVSEVVDSCFIHYYIFTQKLLFVALKQLQTTLWIIDTLFLIDCEPTQHTLFEYSFLIDKCSCKMVFYYLQLLYYLTQLQFTIGQNEFVEFFGVFQDNCQIWATWAFSIICVCTTAFKVSILPLNRCFW